ncbi:YciI family protein [Nitrosomonas sp. HPC101]|uniref:YciI family protein n=1 Tax=Nitrosomonas sp. HPC101 TaxID=1658667 RepID=UPI001368026B|nr:YciI family protein [Nitrosomonas sp. HPC101]MXS86449.1 YciI family protein [Nitrosomonas sp. HPC101]
MLYLIYGEDAPDSLAQRTVNRPAHLARIRELQDQGRLLLAGPCPAIDSADPGVAGFTGSLIVAEFASLEVAREWADADPYLVAGVYAKVTVKPFRKVLPE